MFGGGLDRGVHYVSGHVCEGSFSALDVGLEGIWYIILLPSFSILPYRIKAHLVSGRHLIHISHFQGGCQRLIMLIFSDARQTSLVCRLIRRGEIPSDGLLSPRTHGDIKIRIFPKILLGDRKGRRTALHHIWDLRGSGLVSGVRSGEPGVLRLFSDWSVI